MAYLIHLHSEIVLQKAEQGNHLYSNKKPFCVCVGGVQAHLKPKQVFRRAVNEILNICTVEYNSSGMDLLLSQVLTCLLGVTAGPGSLNCFTVGHVNSSCPSKRSCRKCASHLAESSSSPISFYSCSCISCINFSCTL